LRVIFEQRADAFDEKSLLHESAAHAGSVLAGLPAEVVEATTALGRSIASEDEPANLEDAGVAPFQVERWQAVLDRRAKD
jgi:hypothetical protein